MRNTMQKVAVLFAVLAALAGQALAQPAPGKPAPAKPTAFSSAEDGAKALYEAARSHDRTRLIEFFGADTRDWVLSGDAVADQAAMDKFAAAYERAHALEPRGEAGMTIVVGEDKFPFPFPLVRHGERWSFDAAQGRDELLRRRIGGNELSTIEVMRAIVDAQRDYASQARDGRPTPQYASKFASTAGRHDGLYWPAKVGQASSPLGQLVAGAVRDGYTMNAAGAQPTPYYGYYFRMLTAQGPDAPGGATDYIVNGRMIGGFAVIAYPASYGVSGVMTFIVNDDGEVHEKDLGPNTATIASGIKAYNPDKSWKKD